MARYPRIRSIIDIGIERIVGNTAEAGVASIQAVRFLVQVGVRRIKHKSVAVSAFKLCLVGIRLAMTKIPEAQQEVSDIGIGKPRKVCSRGHAIPVIYIARGKSIAGSRVPSDIIWLEFIKVFARYQPMCWSCSSGPGGRR